jgi:ABC-type nickel/cobalt efflux system permease component RcnA
MTVLDAGARPAAAGSAAVRTVMVAAVALGVVVLIATLVSLAMGPTPAVPPARNPFGVGVREGGGAAGGLAGWILAVQSDFYRRLTTLVRGIAADGASVWPLVTAGFLYGVFHAAGPGHGKAVISAWILANERALGRGIALAFAAAILQAIVAIAIVAVLSLLIGASARTMTGVTGAVETASFAAVAALGGWLLWRKAGDVVRRLWPALAAPHAHAPGDACDDGCGHVHLPGPEAVAAGWRAAAGVVLAAGLRPCTGAIIVLVFALSQKVFAAGIAATFAMALGTALVTGALAALAVYAKAGALRLAAAGGSRAAMAGAALETLAAAAVLALGGALLVGVWKGGGL